MFRRGLVSRYDIWVYRVLEKGFKQLIIGVLGIWAFYYIIKGTFLDFNRPKEIEVRNKNLFSFLNKLLSPKYIRIKNKEVTEPNFDLEIKAYIDCLNSHKNLELDYSDQQ